MPKFEVEIVFALPDRQSLRKVSVTPGDSVADVIAKSGLKEAFPEYDIDGLSAGIWGREVQRTQVVTASDRVEIYRPLELDPRDARRRLALAGRTMGSATLD